MAHGQAAPLNFDGVDVAHAFPTSNFLDHLKKRNMFIGEYIKKNPTGPLPSGNHVVTNQRVPLPPELSVTRNRHNSNLKRAFQIGLNLETQSGRALGLPGTENPVFLLSGCVRCFRTSTAGWCCLSLPDFEALGACSASAGFRVF